MYKNRGLISDWDVLRLVLAIDRHGGVSGAARHLGVTHATVSRRLARAEEDAGRPFFERLPAGLRLTEAGRTVLRHAQRLAPEIDGLERSLLQQEPGLSGPLRVTIPPLMLTADVAADMRQFSQTHRDIALEVLGGNALLNLHQRDADIAIRVTRKPPETLWGRKLTDQDAGFYAQTGWLSQNALGQGDLTGAIPVISFAAWKSPLPAVIAATCPQAYVAARSDDMISAIALVKAGLGITRIPKVVAEATQGISRITALPWQDYLPIWALTHPDLRKTPKLRAFMDHVGAGIAKRQGLYRAVEDLR